MTEAAGTKRLNEDSSWEGGKKMRGENLTLRFLLNSKHAGGIIGKGGETIKRLRSEFSATVTVPDTTTQERVLTIGADQENGVKVLRECLPLVHEAPYPVNNSNRGDEGKDSNVFEIDFLVHSSQVGGIIGKAGYKIKEIREQTSANIKVYQECLPDSTERVVAIGGSADQLVAALEMIFKVMEENPIKGNITLYDPSYEHNTGGGYDNFNSYNNYNNPPPFQQGGGMRGGRGGGNGPRGGMRGGHGGGGGNYGPPPQQGGYGMGQQQDYSGNNFNGGDNWNNSNNWNQGPPPQQADYGYGGNTGGPPADGGYNAGNNNNNAGNNFGGPPAPAAAGGGNSTQVTIPNDMAGAIIGRGGERIRTIRQKCGADIKFSDSEQGKSDRLITISGTHDQIQHAQYLMQQCVREHHGAGRT